MKKDEIPQDPSALDKFTKEVCYAVDSAGNYVTELSRGWEVKDIEQRITAARLKVQNGEASPLLFFMELRLMDTGIVSAYTGFWKWQVKRHLIPAVFAKLSDKKLEQYAEAFNVSVTELKTMEVHEG
jgi:hypothetical protein